MYFSKFLIKLVFKITMETFYNIALSMLKGVGIHTATTLLELTNGNSKELFNLSKETLYSLNPSMPRIFTQKSKDIALKEAEKELKFIESNNINALFFKEKEYPIRLKDIKSAPIVLYRKGNINLNKLRCLSIVGTRQPTQRGIETTKELIKDIAKLFPDTLIISGLAYGIDITAHKSALENHLPTAAILGHGLQTIYPAIHKSVAERICNENGSLITKYRSDAPIFPANFIERNTIIAGLSDATIVIESKKRGGSLTTAKIAQSYGRDVMAIPGNLHDEKSVGCNKLIKTQIAALIENAQDIGYTLNWDTSTEKQTQQKIIFDLLPEEDEIVTLLQRNGKMSIDALSIETKKTMQILLPTITQLEFKGLLLSHPGKFYSLKK